MTSTHTSSAPAPAGTSRRAVPLYIGGGALSLFGNSAIGIVLPWLVLSRTGDLSTTGLVATAAGIAAVPASILGGTLADRLGARRVAVAADVGSALAVAALPVVDALWGLSVAWFVVLGAAGALFDVPGMTARQSLLAPVARVGGVGVDTVAGAFQTSFSLSFLVGPALAGVLLGVLEPIQVVWLTAACSAVAAVMTWLVPVSNPDPVSSADVPDQGGLRLIRRDPRLRAVLLISFFAVLVSPPLMSVILPGHFASTDSPGAFGTTVSMFAIGTLVGSVLYVQLAKRSRQAAYLTSMAAMTVGLAVISGLDGVVLIGAGMAALGLGTGLFGPVWNVFVAENVPERSRARVLSWVNALALVAGPIGLGALSVVLAHSTLGTAARLVVVVWIPVALYAVLNRSARDVARPAVHDEAHADDR